MNIDLLNKICSSLEQEPKRFHMGEWVSINPESDLNIPFERLAPCGTTACIAGFAVMLDQCDVPADPDNWRKTMTGLNNFSIQDWAKELLQLSENQAAQLFRVTCWPSQFMHKYTSAPNATVSAQVAVERIKHFIKTDGTDEILVNNLAK